MNKIHKQIKLLMKMYLRYTLIITDDIIELKITPKKSSEQEINYLTSNDKQGRNQMFFNLQNLEREERKFN